MIKKNKNINNFGISIIVPTLNSSYLLRNLISSLNIQTFKNWNLIIVDGNSSQNNKKFLKHISKEDKRIKIVFQKSNFIGIYGAMNQGIIYARKKDWITFWGSDDWLPNRNTLMQLFEEIINIPYPIDMTICNVKYLSSDNLILRESSFAKSKMILNSNKYFKRFLMGSIPPHQGAVFSPKFFEYYKPYNEFYRIAADLDFFISIGKRKNFLTYCSNMHLLNLSIGGESQKKILLKIRDLILIYFKYFGFLFFYPLLVRYIKRLMSIKRLS